MFEKKDRREMLVVMLPMCDCLKQHGIAAWKTLEKTMRDVAQSYAAIAMNVEILVCGMTTRDNDYREERLDFYTKATKFQSFRKLQMQLSSSA